MLEESGAITATFIDEVAELTYRLEGNPEKLLHALTAGEVARFRSKSVEELRDYLEQNGYIDTVDPLNSDERERQVLLAVGDRCAPDEIQAVLQWLKTGGEQL